MLSDVHASRDRDGAALATVDPANVFDNRSQGQSAVSVATHGDFVLAWTGGESPDGAGAAAPDGDGDGVFVRAFDCAGRAGQELQVNTYTTGAQNQPAVSVGADGTVVVAWTDAGLDGDGAGIFARRYRLSPSCPLCGDAGDDGAVRASDALTILRAAVGSDLCEPARCDTNDDGDVAATDASAVLRYAVGLRVVVACPLPEV